MHAVGERDTAEGEGGGLGEFEGDTEGDADVDGEVEGLGDEDGEGELEGDALEEGDAEGTGAPAVWPSMVALSNSRNIPTTQKSSAVSVPSSI